MNTVYWVIFANKNNTLIFVGAMQTRKLKNVELKYVEILKE